MNETDEFVELYRVHYPRVVAALSLIGADHAKAEYLGQEAFARAGTFSSTVTPTWFPGTRTPRCLP